jgi:hypothetical protein
VDATFVEGAAAVIAAITVFCGSVFFILTMVMGGRLAYFVTASVTLGFLLILGLIWSFTNPATPLGPVGKLPLWEPIAIAEEGQPLEAPAAESYPEEPWAPVDQEDQEQVTQASELGSDALDSLEAAVADGDLPESAQDNTANSDSVRFLEQEGDLVGAVVLEPPQGTEAPSIVTIMQFDPGDPLGVARMITLGTFLLLAGHLFVLSRLEKRAQRPREATT